MIRVYNVRVVEDGSTISIMIFREPPFRGETLWDPESVTVADRIAKGVLINMRDQGDKPFRILMRKRYDIREYILERQDREWMEIR